MSREKPIQQQILLDLGGLPGVRLFRQNVGNFWQGQVHSQGGGFVTLENPRRVQCGLAPGSSDIIGLQSVVIAPEHVGQTLARFVAVEVKGSKGRPTAEQEAFIAMVQRFGGVAGIARSVAEAERILRRLI